MLVVTALMAAPAFPQAAGAAKMPDPEFRSEKYATSFAKGKAAFEAEEYKDAGKAFKSAARGGKTKEDKKLVTKWAHACKGGPVLKQVTALRERKYWNEALDRLSLGLRKFAGTPIEAAFRKEYDEVDRLVYMPIETFDQPSPRFGKKFGKTFIKDPKLQANGTICLHWQSIRNGKPGVLVVKNVPPDWSAYRTLEFWINVRAPGKGEVLLMSTPGKKKGQTGRSAAPPGKAVQSCLQHSLVLPRKGGWQYIRLDLSKFNTQGGADLSRVNQFRIQFATGIVFDMFLDDVRLRKNNPPQGKAKSGKATSRKR
jgi:hypothetical protein